tara:strand:+ start:206 stop:424 length:219 start_codon:yes stop_codon:yes gene_type:complete
MERFVVLAKPLKLKPITTCVRCGATVMLQFKDCSCGFNDGELPQEFWEECPECETMHAEWQPCACGRSHASE